MLEMISNAIQYAIDMGASVMLPIVIALISILIGVKVGKAIRSGLMVGVGFVGLGLIVDLMNAELGPAAAAMSERFGLSLSVVDIGWPGASPMTWASNIATVAIPVAIGVNLVMLLLKMTKTVNIDIWNIWHMTFTGAIAYAVTGNFWLGILGVVIHAAISYKLGDLWAPLIADYFELDGLTSPHGTSAYMAPIACVVDAIIDKIPGLNKIDITADTLQEKVGIFGEPIVIGGILGAGIGFLAGYDVQTALPLGIKMSAVMVLMPKIVKCIMEGLMPLSERAKEMLLNAQAGGYAVGAFNVENMEMVQAVVEAAEELQSPVILQTTPSTVKYAGLDYFYANVKVAAEKASVPVVMHLDHGNSFPLAMQALRTGYTSIMIDGSHESFEENVKISKAVVDACKPSGISVEAELGKVGGKEDDLDGGEDNPYTDPMEAKTFVEKTGVDSLAVGIGTAHGVYQGVPKLDVERLSEIRKVVSIPLVLHGTSGVPDEAVKECIKRGICKVNYATDLRIAYTNGVKKVLAKNPDTIDPKKYGSAGREEVKQYVKSKILVCGSASKGTF